ncbi:hypothetical protein P7K49_033613 [Saguinus oedipus]|uniref:Uncharacterized protein n=1 Tax=Saguinus oedipus TaxID=9490 RepID=A0ABQ9TSF7_SAGOE|nr:hypothetical protein P7K49_033613 [Saguinus oedipus]
MRLGGGGPGEVLGGSLAGPLPALSIQSLSLCPASHPPKPPAWACVQLSVMKAPVPLAVRASRDLLGPPDVPPGSSHSPSPPLKPIFGGAFISFPLEPLTPALSWTLSPTVPGIGLPSVAHHAWYGPPRRPCSVCAIPVGL